jgi:uncharacterized protein (DUF849 family)
VSASLSALGCNGGLIPFTKKEKRETIRVGKEGNADSQRGPLAKTNAQFVERIVRLARQHGREAASPPEARQILGLPQR